MTNVDKSRKKTKKLKQRQILKVKNQAKAPKCKEKDKKQTIQNTEQRKDYPLVFLMATQYNRKKLRRT